MIAKVSESEVQMAEKRNERIRYSVHLHIKRLLAISSGDKELPLFRAEARVSRKYGTLLNI